MNNKTKIVIQDAEAPRLSPLPEFSANATVEENVITALKTVFDPELPVNIYDLGLIYNLHATKEGEVTIEMTLTAPNCPMADKIVDDAQKVVEKVPNVTNVNVMLIWEPKWTKDRMSEAAKLELGLF